MLIDTEILFRAGSRASSSLSVLFVIFLVFLRFSYKNLKTAIVQSYGAQQQLLAARSLPKPPRNRQRLPENRRRNRSIPPQCFTDAAACPHLLDGELPLLVNDGVLDLILLDDTATSARPSINSSRSADRKAGRRKP